MFNGIAELIVGLLVIVGIGCLFGGYMLCDRLYNGIVIESSVRIAPEIKLTTDGTKIDTVYVYRYK